MGGIKMNNILQYKGFWTRINYEEETSTFWGKLEDIEDLVSFEADTIEGLKKEFKDAVDEHIEECKALNRDPYKKYKGSFNVRIEPELHKKATLFAEGFNMSLNQFVAKAIRDEIEACERKSIKCIELQK